MPSIDDVRATHCCPGNIQVLHLLLTQGDYPGYVVRPITAATVKLRNLHDDGDAQPLLRCMCGCRPQRHKLPTAPTHQQEETTCRTHA
jgi:hypothetical protein